MIKLIPRNRDFFFFLKIFFFDKNILFCIINFTSSEKGGKFENTVYSTFSNELHGNTARSSICKHVV